MRVDLSDELTDSVEHIAGVAATLDPTRRSRVVVDEGGASCRMCNDDYRRLAASGLSTRWPSDGIELLAAHVVDQVAAGGTVALCRRLRATRAPSRTRPHRRWPWRLYLGRTQPGRAPPGAQDVVAVSRSDPQKAAMAEAIG